MYRGEFVDGEVAECHHSRFSIGVAGYPETHVEATDPPSDLLRLGEKVAAGADYVVTQMCFDNRRFFDFCDRCRDAGIDVPIIPGIKPLADYRHLDVLPRTFGVTLPPELAAEVERHRHNAQAIREIGIEWAIAQARELRARGVPVIHFYTMGRTLNIARIARAVF